MPTTLRWIASSSASAFHVAEAIARGQSVTDEGLVAVLAEPAMRLKELFETAQPPGDALWQHITPLAAGIHNNRELAHVVLTKAIGRGSRHAALVDALAAAITSLKSAHQRAAPNCIEQLELRSGPLREQWEARGPGLLAHIGRFTQEDLLVADADALLVQPVSGGGGRAHSPYNSVRIEAVLANARPELPEIARLAWLLAQLNNDLPANQGNLPRGRATEVGGLALLLPVLTAAEEVELGRCDSATLIAALQTWQPTASEAAVAGTLEEWWQVYSQTRPVWPVALAALDRMLVQTKL
jgi:hypothetical protein